MIFGYAIVIIAFSGPYWSLSASSQRTDGA